MAACHDRRMWLLPFLPLALAVVVNTCLFLVRPAVKRHKARQEEAPKPVPEKREPRDLSRPYPKRVVVGPDDERLTTCPICKMDDPLFLDGGPTQVSFFGWPAHATCVEWLGKWEPPAPPRPLPKYTYVGGQAIPPEPVYLGGTVATATGGMTMNEFREGLTRMTQALLTPGGTVGCECGMSFSGNAADAARSLDVHRTSGQHERCMAYLRSRNG